MNLQELLDLFIRWFHVIAGIMWIGNSLLFNWLDRNLIKKPGIDGEIWLLHSGGFYQVEKKLLKPGQMPAQLHWFKYQNLSTWVSGILLLVVVYYLGGAALMTDPNVAQIQPGAAIALAVGVLLGAWLIYEVLWITPLKRMPGLAGAVLFGLIMGSAWIYHSFLGPRAAYMHVGVLIGTVMTSNVWTVIIPSQRELVAATESGAEQDRRLSELAKSRSIHNNYLTFPLIFIMVSNHFPATYGHRLSLWILAALMAGGALTRHLMNIRFYFKPWLPLLACTVAVTVAGVYVMANRPAVVGEDAAIAAGPPVPWIQARAVISQRCVPCHSATPSDSMFTMAPNGVMFDRPEQIRRMAPRIRLRVRNHTMPFANRTNMTDAERTLIVRWIAQGARVASE
jgi:uncharacterized membrane protein